ncbi:MAG TPA: DinB family protein [Candidatus Saccharimonadia bacterium]|nr:DinB family protein [Candidatus Saccharimonadia bacterium]
MADRPALLERLVAFPARLAAAAQVAREPPAGEWSSPEVVRHLVAVEEEVWHARLDQLAAAVRWDAPQWHHTEPPPRVLPDPSLAAALAAFAEHRAATVSRLSSLDVPGWARTGRHDTYGLLDVDGLVRLAVDHDDEHLVSLTRAASRTTAAT